MSEITLVSAETPSLTEEETSLVKAAQRDPEMFAAIYQRYLNPIYHYLLARVRVPQIAEDLTAQVFLQALEELPKYRPMRPFSAWLFTIARRRAVDHFRRSRELISLEDEHASPTSSPDPLSQVLQNERLAALSSLLGRLDEDERELLRLRFAAGLSFAAIAVLHGQKESAVKMTLYRLLARLESQLGKDND